MKGILSKSVVFSVDIQILVLTVTIIGDVEGRNGCLVAFGGLDPMVEDGERPMIVGAAAAARKAGRRVVALDD